MESQRGLSTASAAQCPQLRAATSSHGEPAGFLMRQARRTCSLAKQPRAAMKPARLPTWRAAHMFPGKSSHEQPWRASEASQHGKRGAHVQEQPRAAESRGFLIWQARRTCSLPRAATSSHGEPARLPICKRGAHVPLSAEQPWRAELPAGGQCPRQEQPRAAMEASEASSHGKRGAVSPLRAATSSHGEPARPLFIWQERRSVPR